MSKTKIALVQMKMSSDPKKNIQNAINKINSAAKKGAKVICLPELFMTKYFCQVESHKNFNFAEKIPGPSSNLFSALAKELKIILIISLFEKKTSGLYHNSSVVINEKGKLLGKYRKMHIPDDPLSSDEDFDELIRRIDVALEDAVRRVMTCKPDYFVLGISSESIWGGGLEKAQEIVQRMKPLLKRKNKLSTFESLRWHDH